MKYVTDMSTVIIDSSHYMKLVSQTTQMLCRQYRNFQAETTNELYMILYLKQALGTEALQRSSDENALTMQQHFADHLSTCT